MSKWVKILILLGVFAVYAILRLSFIPIELNNRAIILGVGIDFDGEKDMYKLSAEIITPKTSGSGSETGAQAGGQKIVKGEGVSVSLAVRDLYNCFGKTPSFGECCIVLIGEDCAKRKSLKDVLDYFFASSAFRDGTVVAICNGEAEKMLTRKSQIDDYVSFALQTLLVDSDGKAQIDYTTFNYVAQSFFNKSNGCYVNYVEFLPQKDEETAQTGTPDSSSVSSEQGKFYTGQAVLFRDGKYVGKLYRQELDGLNLGGGKNVFCTFTDVTRPSGRSLGVIKKRGGMDVAIEEEKVVVSLKLTLTVSELLTDTTGEVLPLQAKQSEKLNYMQKQGAKRQAEEAVLAAYQKAVDLDCDIWEIKNELYARYGKEIEKVVESENFWQNVTFLVDIECIG